MPTYYVDPATGNDANTEAQAQSASTPWATIQTGALPKLDASAEAVTVYIANGTTEDVGAYLNINYSFANQVTITPLTDPGDGEQGWTLIGTGAGGAVIRPYHGTAIDIDNLRIEHCHIKSTGAWTCFYCPTNGAIDNLEFRDCKFEITTHDNQHCFNWIATTMSGSALVFTRCTFQGLPAGVGSANGKIEIGANADGNTVDGIVFEDCVSRDISGIYLLVACDALRVVGNDLQGNFIPLHIGSQSVVGNRITNADIRGNTIVGTGTSHASYFNCDSSVLAHNYVDTGSTGDYALVTKYGDGFAVHGNTAISRAASGSALIVKGVQNGTYVANKLYHYSTGSVVSVYENDAAGGAVCNNIVVANNVIVATGGGNVYYLEDTTTGLLCVTGNVYGWSTGNSHIMGAAAAPTLAAQQSRWEAIGRSYGDKAIFDSRRFATRLLTLTP